MNRSPFFPLSAFPPIGRRPLGRTGLLVSEICLGTMNFGWRLDRDASFLLLDRFAQAGGNFIQALSIDSDAMTASFGMGHPETYVGDWMVERGVRRQDWVLSSRLTLQRSAGRNIGDRITRSVERSLSRLGTDYLDLLICEWTPAFLPMNEMLAALHALVKEGKLRYFALAGFPAWRVMESMSRSRILECSRLEAVQTDYSLVQRRGAEEDLAELCEDNRISVIVSSPLADGFLANLVGTPSGFSPQRSNRLRDYRNHPRSRAVLAKLAAVARAHGVTEARVAIAWSLTRPWVTSVLVGSHTADYLTDVLGGSRLQLSSREIAGLDEVSSPPRHAHSPCHCEADTPLAAWPTATALAAEIAHG
ncbi:MAG: aldo/keto reductase [Rariglobus sp.]